MISLLIKSLLNFTVLLEWNLLVVETFVCFIKLTVEYKEHIINVSPHKLKFLNILDRLSSLKLMTNLNFHRNKHIVHQREKMLLWTISCIYYVS